MYAPGGFNATSRHGRRKASTPRSSCSIICRKNTPASLFDRRECGQSGGRVERVTWAHYVAQGKGLLDHLNIEPRPHHGRLHGVLPGDGFRRGPPETTLSMVLYLAGRRRQVPHQQPPALRRAPRFRSAARPRRGGRAGHQGRQDVRRRPARRTVGGRDQGRPCLRRRLCRAGHRCLQAHRRRHGTHHVRP